MCHPQITEITNQTVDIRFWNTLSRAASAIGEIIETRFGIIFGALFKGKSPVHCLDFNSKQEKKWVLEKLAPKKIVHFRVALDLEGGTGFSMSKNYITLQVKLLAT